MAANDSDAIREIESMLESLSEAVETRDFRPRAEAVQTAMKAARINPSDRNRLWGQYQSLWEKRRQHTAQRESASHAKYCDWRDRLIRLEILPDTIDAVCMDSDDWNTIGNKVGTARAELREIQNEMKADNSLIRKHRDDLYRRAQDAFNNINRAQNCAQDAQARVAARLLNESDSAVSSSPIRDAWEILKANSAQMRALYLRRSDRDLYQGAMDDLWDRLKAKKQDAHIEWRQRQESGLRRLREALAKARSALSRVEANISDNEDRLSTSRSDEYTTRVEGWIAEGREKAADIERSISDLEEKISDAERRLEQ